MSSSSPTSPADAWLGQVLGDRYRLVAQIGAGGMGVVYRAWDLKNDRYVVVKMPQRQFLREPQFLQRFERELSTLQTLSHKSVVPIIDVGVEQDTPYAVMPYLAGGSLKQRIRVDADGQMVADEPSMLWLWLPAIAHALDDVHGNGFIHRDVKPDNILFDGLGRPYLSDFGIAKLMLQEESNAASRGLTGTGFALGTADYMAPELTSGTAPSGRVDQYALAVVVYELLSGVKPFRGATPAAVMIAHATTEARPLASVRANIPPQLSAAVDRALSKDPAGRFGRCVDFAAAVLKGVAKPEAAGKTRLMCPQCGRLLSVKHDWAGKKGNCPRCQTAIAISSDMRSLWIPSDREAPPTPPPKQAVRPAAESSEGIALKVAPDRRSPTGQYRKARKKSARISWALQGLGVLALVAGGYGLFSVLKGNGGLVQEPKQIAAAGPQEPSSDDGADSHSQTVDSPSPDAASPEDPASPVTEPPAGDADEQPFEKPPADEPGRKPASRLAIDDFGEPYSDSPFAAAEPKPQASGGRRSDDSTEAENEDVTAVPEAEAITKAVDLIKQAFAEEYAEWAESGEAGELIEKLRESARSSTNPVRRYALLAEAERIALKAHDLQTAIDIVNDRREFYDFDLAQAEQAAIGVLAGERNLSAEGVYLDALALANQRLEQESMQVATDAAGLAVMVARAMDREQRAAATKARREQREQTDFSAPLQLQQDEDGGQMILKAVDLQKTIRVRQRLVNDYKQASDMLTSSPDDAAAHGTVAQYLCFAKGDWENGLSHMAAGNLGAVSKLAKRESELREADEADTAAIFALAGDWWSAAETIDNDLGGVDAVKRHAASLYEQVLPDLDDPIEQTLAEKRMKAILTGDDEDGFERF